MNLVGMSEYKSWMLLIFDSSSILFQSVIVEFAIKGCGKIIFFKPFFFINTPKHSLNKERHYTDYIFFMISVIVLHD